MIKKRFKQYTLLKHKRRLQSFDFAFTQQAEGVAFCAPNRITRVLFKNLPISLSGYNYYKEAGTQPLVGTLLKQNNVIFPGSWVPALENISKKPFGLSALFPHTMLVRVFFVLQARLVTVLNANIL